VETLANQCKQLDYPYEIICYDDCSSEEHKVHNRELDGIFGVSYVELSENLGRSKIRNWLAKNARYESLLFIDCDSEVDRDDFVASYVNLIGEAQVIYGGRKYDAEKPSDTSKTLHWKYGGKREAMPLKDRLKIPYRSFQTNNFLIDRSLILAHPFDEKIKTYGYEDLLIAETFKNKGIPIFHIENPLIHKGLEAADDFLKKSKDAAENLAILYHQQKLTDTKMISFHKKLKMLGFNSLLNTLIRRKKDGIIDNLLSNNPNLFYFDLYRYELFSSKLNEL
jgi:glycosyltransferase involved in cell wall biosynthesis